MCVAAEKQNKPFSFPLASKKVIMGMNTDEIKKTFPSAKNREKEKEDAEFSEILLVEFGIDNVFFKFKGNRLVMIETSSGTEGPGHVLDKFSKWLGKKYGRGKTTDKKDGNIKTVWNLPNANLMEYVL
jgi:hypothetical protein